jgi:CDP-glycerol glycerophosphotransferase
LQLDRVPGLRQLPARLTRRQPDIALFDSWRGAYSDNPRAISETLRKRRPELRQVWVAAEPVVPAWAEPVAFGSRAYLAALGSASYVVTNHSMPGYYRKPRGTAYLQTWHGTPLKRIAFDIRGSELADRRYFDRLKRDVARWDALVSPNPFSTEIFRRAFRYEGRILETGYPRNDLLTSPAGSARRQAVREALGLADATRAILYAPTWRDEWSFDLRLDTGALSRRLGDGHALLLRPHPNAPVAVSGERGTWTIDVSGEQDIRDLYLAADVLLTDYSSAMFDFAITRKPMLFFTYDLAEYRDVTRGFYFDFEHEAPGPLLATTGEVGDALEDLDAVSARHAQAYEAFRERYSALEDGAAAERVVSAFFDD